MEFARKQRHPCGRRLSSTEEAGRWYNPPAKRQEENGMLLQEAGREIEELRKRLEQIADHL
jgi:hypothetical protein